MTHQFIVDRMIEQAGGELSADAVRLVMGSGGLRVSCPELARILDVSPHTVWTWRRADKTRPRHLRARLIEAELLLRDRRRRERRR